MANYRRAFIENSCIFITVVTFNRLPTLTDHIDLLKNSIRYSQQRIIYQIIGLVILPNHFHIIIQPETITEYPKIVSTIKAYFSRNINVNDLQNAQALLSTSYYKKREKCIWQRRYWEHTICNEKDLARHLDYIHYNPVKHGLVTRVNDWKYSSFHLYLKSGYYDKGWGSTDDVKDIIEINME